MFLTKHEVQPLHWYCGKSQVAASKILSHVTKLEQRQEEIEARMTAMELQAVAKYEEFQAG